MFVQLERIINLWNMINLITETEIKTYSTIDMNVAGKYLTEAIRSAQNIDLCQIIGSKLLSKLETNKFLVELTKYVLHLILHQVVLGGQMGKKTIGKLIGEDKQLYEVKRTQKNSQSRVCHEEHLVLIELVAYLPKIILG